MTGALIITVIKKASREGALEVDRGQVRGSRLMARWRTDCIPPGSRKVPPTKSQKNLRQIKPQNPAQKVSARTRAGWPDELIGDPTGRKKEENALTNAGSDSDKAGVFVPNELSHICLTSS
jgi:hypothetical protein